ncbi:hypothetical protein ACIBL5_38220 [Streptomyces sp. NPDC050516]|uniref:hypothetical protein n=1 Tax=Streptomyces sp. NPDC050516 TaxID=3365621 RepID=UPI003794C74C
MSHFSRVARRTLALVSVGLLSAGLATATATQASAAAESEITVIDGYTQAVKESAGTPVVCPPNQVLLGRSHSGDENGNTTYYCGLVIIDGELAKVSAPQWSDSQRESNSFFSAPTNQVLVGRQHSGDENGPTRYATASLSAGGRTVELTSYRWTPDQRESNSYSKAGDQEIMIGRQHTGDENGPTRYEYAAISN